MIVQLKNSTLASIRLLHPADNENLFEYLGGLSGESRSWFGPHLFDKETVNSLCLHLPEEILRYIAIAEDSQKIIAYMLIKRGMTEWDMKRYALRNQFFDETTAVTYAPSVADNWQSSGLGSIMYEFIEEGLKTKGLKCIILWGGVQAANQKAVRFYNKYGFRRIDSFYHDGKENYDMIKYLY
jgi:diamine N-acetyltransferase